MHIPEISNQVRGTQIFLKSREHFKILGTKRVASSKLHSEDPQAIGAMATWRLTLVHP